MVAVRRSGAVGGALVEVLSVFKSVGLWQSDRRLPSGEAKEKPPALRKYVDPPATAWLLAFRMGLGAGAATLFGMTGQIQGTYAAIGFGFAAPSILAQLGSIPQVKSIVKGDDTGGPSGEATRNDGKDGGEA